MSLRKTELFGSYSAIADDDRWYASFALSTVLLRTYRVLAEVFGAIANLRDGSLGTQQRPH